MSAATKRPPQAAQAAQPHHAPQSERHLQQQQQPTLWLLEIERESRAAFSPSHVTRAAGAPSANGCSSSDGAARLDVYGWVKRCEPLSAQEEARLARRMRTGDRLARERLFAAGARWALTIARWHATQRAPLDDLAQVAWLTLWQVLPDFDPGEGRLTTFVWQSVLRDVRRAVDEMSSPIRRPQHVVDAERREWRFVERYEQEHGHEPSDELLAMALDTPPAHVRQLTRQARRRPVVVSLDAERAVQTSRSGARSFAATLAETIPSEDPRDDPDGVMARGERSQAVAAFVASPDARLTAREQQVLALMYCDDHRLADDRNDRVNSGEKIARVLGMSRSRVQALHQTALRKLRQANARSGGTLSALYAEMDD